MSTATNGAATEAALQSLTGASRAAGKAAVDAVSSVRPAAETAGQMVRHSGQIWLDASNEQAAPLASMRAPSMGAASGRERPSRRWAEAELIATFQP